MLKSVQRNGRHPIHWFDNADIDISWLYLRWRLPAERMFRLAFLLRIDAIPVIATKSNMIVNNTLCFK